MTKTILDCLKEYLHALSSIGSRQEKFILEYGREWTPTPLPDLIEVGMPRNCYGDAFIVAFHSRGELTYVEGIAIGEIPTLHAWAVTINGEVVDPTWASTVNGIGSAYYGVPFSIEYVRKRIVEIEHYHSVIDDYGNDWPLLQEPMRSQPERWFADHPLHPLLQFTTRNIPCLP